VGGEGAGLAGRTVRIAEYPDVVSGVQLFALILHPLFLTLSYPFPTRNPQKAIMLRKHGLELFEMQNRAQYSRAKLGSTSLGGFQ
jgi:hypothetical protein